MQIEKDVTVIAYFRNIPANPESDECTTEFHEKARSERNFKIVLSKKIIKDNVLL